ncbi:hypothetical protein PROFUN_13866 [Planoprotostelium fungivorum]|uniref:Uncharacterized protein n=1 Tax=Planoprotostelium fungivorum TaxID=1890364 RepID=A0A2P6N2N7_9EUKA|nr:hypothetical protein PROFUN_13981 [Planoprotostelium fungivorum]PRP78256.1 hypothetical protein PROFUN_13866 [Planoprotostelium fungivorum]
MRLSNRLSGNYYYKEIVMRFNAFKTFDDEQTSTHSYGLNVLFLTFCSSIVWLFEVIPPLIKPKAIHLGHQMKQDSPPPHPATNS